MLQWDTLLSATRYGHPADPDPNRSDFHRDYDRIVFSTAFRRLGRKTQVHPFSVNDHVHSRLTHSLEVSSVGRSLAITVYHLIKKHLPKYVNEYQFGTIVQSACLAHDIGNPPFGHAGEAAIREWFRKNRHSAPMSELSDKEIADFENFDGNAQGHRILSKLEYHFLDGGMRLTYATIGSMIKYPRLAYYGCPTSLFRTEAELYRETAEILGIPEIENGVWARHPLVYLMEAADDICYEIMDIEDAHKLKLLTTDETRQLLLGFFDGTKRERILERMNSLEDVNEQIVYLRSCVINCLEQECSRVFVEHEEEILSGTFEGSLIKHISDIPRLAYERCADTAEHKIYHCKDVVDIEIAGYRVITTLTDLMVKAVTNTDKAFSRLLISRVSAQYDIKATTLYGRLMAVLDYISGMTDVFALDLYRKINGMSLPIV